MTAKQERFCQEIVKGTSQVDAYRTVFKPKKKRAAWVHVRASEMMAKGMIQVRIQELMAPLVSAAQLTREEWIRDAVRLYRGDVRKLFDEHGNPIDIPNLADSEADLIEGFEVVEDFTKVKKNEMGAEQAVCTGYTKKYKLTSRKERHLYVGKALGYYIEKHAIVGPMTMEQLVSLMTTDLKPEPKLLNG